jgi:transposase
VTTVIPLPAGLPLEATSWVHTPLVVRQWVVHLLTVIEPQARRITALDARVSQNSRNSDRPPSSDPPYAKRPARSGA